MSIGVNVDLSEANAELNTFERKTDVVLRNQATKARTALTLISSVNQIGGSVIDQIYLQLFNLGVTTLELGADILAFESLTVAGLVLLPVKALALANIATNLVQIQQARILARQQTGQDLQMLQSLKTY